MFAEVVCSSLKGFSPGVKIESQDWLNASSG
jgi:hypothetical protein